ncbi:hypothetical protein M6B38_106220 [Iris pallida]|uniref:Uncharacterized protein n=1 Tax=Iris pallida TaxID=29817 RepID=A0AAX6ET20_IRIPA|nr:hypothetical protein M6B38_106220 [Iris pallida]
MGGHDSDPNPPSGDLLPAISSKQSVGRLSDNDGRERTFFSDKFLYFGDWNNGSTAIDGDRDLIDVLGQFFSPLTVPMRAWRLLP